MADESILKALLRITTCLQSTKYQSKLVSSSPIIFDDNIRLISVAFFGADFILFSCETDKFIFVVFYGVILH